MHGAVFERTDMEAKAGSMATLINKQLAHEVSPARLVS